MYIVTLKMLPMWANTQATVAGKCKWSNLWFYSSGTCAMMMATISSNPWLWPIRPPSLSRPLPQDSTSLENIPLPLPSHNHLMVVSLPHLPSHLMWGSLLSRHWLWSPQDICQSILSRHVHSALTLQISVFIYPSMTQFTYLAIITFILAALSIASTSWHCKSLLL